MIKKILAVAAIVLLVGCSEDDNNDKSAPAIKTCTSDTCKDASTLNKCNNGKVVEIKCAAGQTCTDNMCRDTASPDGNCTADSCRDAKTLNKCENGKIKVVPCADGETCTDNACRKNTPSGEKCVADKCKDGTTLIKCTDGIAVEQKCGSNEYCADNKCYPMAGDPDKCTADSCKNDYELYKCENGRRVKYECKPNELCVNDKCIDKTDISDGTCIVPVCTGDTEYVECNNGKVGDKKQCGTDEICEGGGCMKSFTLDDKCSDPDGFGKCTADGKNAIVCHKGKIKRYTCADPCKDGQDGLVNCPKKPTKPVYDECDPQTDTPTCIDNKSKAKVCQKHRYVIWECANNSCSVNAKNEITCDRPVPEGAVTEGGTFGTVCNDKLYQEACIDDHYARICDYDLTVKIRPASDCKISAADSHKVEYNEIGSLCDPANDINPKCINNGQAIGFCTYDKKNNINVFTAAQCPNCSSEERAKECMLEN